MEITKNDIQDCMDYIKFMIHKNSPLSQEKKDAIFTIMSKAKNAVDAELNRKKKRDGKR